MHPIPQHAKLLKAMSAIRTLQLWRDIEMFQVFDLDDVLVIEDDAWHVSLTAPLHTDTPWSAPEAWGLNPEYNYGFDLFMGIFDKAAVKTIVRQLYDDDNSLEEFDDSRNVDGTTCLVRLGITSVGEALVEDCRIATLPWALTALKRGSELSLDAFDSYGRDLLMRIASCRASAGQDNQSQSDAETQPLHWSDILAINREVMRDIEIPWHNFSDRVVIVAHRLSKKKLTSQPSTDSSLDADRAKSNTTDEGSTDEGSTGEESAKDEFGDLDAAKSRSTSKLASTQKSRIRRRCEILNSFYLRDLQKIAQRSARIPKGSPLTRYLSATQHPHRVDVAKPSARLWSGVSPRALSLGRWPHKTDHFNSLMQQLAVNELMSGKHQVLAVNGPPGTGKTTLVKDVVAGFVVQRALKLVRFRSPDDAFEKKPLSCEVERSRFVIRKLKKELTGFEIVVASSNNNAVENITRELPKRSALGDVFAGESYLAEVARLYELLRQRPKRADSANTNDSRWALVSAPLGNRRNRELFCDSLLYGPTEDKDEKSRRQEVGLCLTLHEWRKRIPAPGNVSYAKARLLFLAAHKEVEEILERISNPDSNKSELGADGREIDSYITPCDTNFDSLAVQSRAPWLSERLTTAQSKLFLAALALHQAWAREAAGLGKNLAAIGKLLSRPEVFDEHAATCIWQTLFMVVPVVSTTLASVERMCASVGAGVFGTAIIEEAGQATPQSVSGILWRSKRALIIGDPMQIQPVVSAPDVLIRHFCKKHDITNPLVSPLASSAQSLADESSELGTYLEQSIASTWIGSPLRVHRRCIEPMFSISNTIAYGGLMTYGTESASIANTTLPESAWYDTDGSCVARHWVPQHGEVACGILERALRAGSAYELDIFFITPFRSIKERLAKLLSDRARSLGCSLDQVAAIRRRVGTVHTFQGKEANTVAFILGCDDTTRGAARWAGERPNLLNVAVTRARHRLYVVGSLSLWHNQGFFAELASSLPRIKSSSMRV